MCSIISPTTQPPKKQKEDQSYLRLKKTEDTHELNKNYADNNFMIQMSKQTKLGQHPKIASNKTRIAKFSHQQLKKI